MIYLNNYIDYYNILHDIIKFCNKFEIDFNTQSVKNKKQLIIYYSILQLLIELKNNNLDKPIIVFEKTIKDSTVESCLNKISKINSKILETQCIYLEKAIELCSDKVFLESYEENLEKSIEKRRIIFKQWEELYNLNVYV